MLCIPRLRIAILNEEITLWEKRCDTEPRSNLYYGYIRDMMTNRIKELSACPAVDDTTEGEKDFDYSAIQYHGKTKNYKKQQPEDE